MESLQSEISITTITNLLDSSIKILDDQSKTINTVLEKLNNNGTDEKAHFIKLLNTLDIMKAHLDFTNKILQTSSADEVTAVKTSSKLKGKEYEQVNNKEDFNLVILKEALDYLSEGPLTKLQDVVKRYSAEGENRDAKRIQIDSAWLQILAFRIKSFAQYYPTFSTSDKQDLFSQLKSSEEWQELQKHVTLKTLGTKEEIQKSFSNFNANLLGLFAIVRERTFGVESPQFPSTMSMIKDSFARRKEAELTEAMAQLYFTSPNEYLSKAWGIGDDPLVQMLAGLSLAHIGYDKCIYLPKMFPPITKELLQKEYQNNTINQLGIDHQISLGESKTEAERAEVIRTIFTPSPEKVMVRILSSEPLLIEKNVGEKIGNFFHQARNLFSQSKVAQTKLDSKAIVIHMHGGGFCAGNSALHRMYLVPFANKTKFVHFSIDYSLAPKHQYPEGLNDVWQAYLWILSYAESVLGIKHKKIILMGDSAGGNFVLGITLRLIKSGLPPPDGCFLIYPSVRMSSGLTTPSLIRSLEDPLLPFGVRSTSRKLYLPDDARPDEDPYLSPIVVSDEFLEKLPPVRLVIGTADPLHDDNLRFIHRLVKMKKDAKAVLYEHYVHGFVAMKDLYGWDKVVADCCNVIEELANL